MITDKICYVHLRNQRPDGNYEVKGGATIAWVVDSETGDIVIGKPSRCMIDNVKTGEQGDIFQKHIGRQNAYNNLVFHSPILRVTRDSLVWLATQQATASMNFTTLTPNAINALAEYVKGEIKGYIETFMNSSWYEQIVRSHFTLHPDNRLDIAREPMSPTNTVVGV